jgi:uncharacterized membrane protein YdjX (TVP38/TMEM64 family)
MHNNSSTIGLLPVSWMDHGVKKGYFTPMQILRSLAVFLYIIAAMLALKSFSDLWSGKAAIEGDWESTLVMLLSSIAAAICAWLVDRWYCRKSAAQY